MKNLFVLCFLFIFSIIPTFAEEIITPDQKNIIDEKNEISPVSWNEGLKLKDFCLSPNLISALHNNTLKGFKESLARDYAQHSDTFSISLEYGLLLADLGELDEAHKILSKAIIDFKTNETPRTYKAWVDALKGDYKTAKDIWFDQIGKKIADGYNPVVWLQNDLDAVVGLYLIQDNLDEKDKADVKNIIDKSFDKIVFYPRAGALSIANDLKAGRLKYAEKMSSKIGNRLQNQPIFLTLNGISSLMKDDYKGALEIFNKAEQSYPYSPTLQLMKARALNALGEGKAAKIAYKKAVELNSDLKKSKEKAILKTESFLTLRAAN